MLNQQGIRPPQGLEAQSQLEDEGEETYHIVVVVVVGWATSSIVVCTPSAVSLPVLGFKWCRHDVLGQERLTLVVVVDHAVVHSDEVVLGRLCTHTAEYQSQDPLTARACAAAGTWLDREACDALGESLDVPLLAIPS